MQEYLKKNSKYWADEYVAENVESHVFRVYGRILKPQFGLDGSKKQKVLDFGCGEGANLRFLKAKGFDVYGVDISEWAIAKCKETMPDIADHFKVIPEQPDVNADYFGVKFDLVMGIQSFYYLSDTDLDRLLASLNNQMNDEAIFHATMIDTNDWFWGYAKEDEDGLYKVEFKKERVQVKDYYVNFTGSEASLKDKFSIFKKVHIGLYSSKFRDDEGLDSHYIFIGQKK